ncbi:MAG: hypothetical protein ACOYWZ_08730 [Bacillota bacterium]
MYKEFRLKIRDLLEANKSTIGVNGVYSPLPPFIPKDQYPLVAILLNRATKEQPETTGGVFRPFISATLWIQIIEISRNSVDGIRENMEYCNQLQEQAEDITEKIVALLRERRSLEGICTESSILEVNFQWRPSLFAQGALVVGSTIDFGGTMTSFEVKMI